MNGANNFKRLSEAIKDLPQEAEVVLCGDADIPGQKYLHAVGEALQKKGIATQVILPEMMDFTVQKSGGNDVSDWLHTHADISKLLSEAISFPEAAPLLNGNLAEDTELKLDEQGTAELMARLFSKEIKYVKAYKSWYIYKDGIWQADEKNELHTYYKKLQMHLHTIASECSDDNKRKDIEECIKKLRSCTKRKHVLQLAEQEETLSAHPSEFDTHKHLFNVKNGTLNMNTGELLPHDPNHFITKQSPLRYYPEAEAPLWEQFLQEIFLGKTDIIELVQMMAGLFLTGNINEQYFYVFHGNGANGKSVLINTLMYILNDYSLSADPSTLMVKKTNGNTASGDVARLKGARFVVAHESEDGQRLNVAKMKVLTGGDKIVARHLYKDEIEFFPEFKLVLVTNHKPNISDTSHGAWRRIKLIPFDYTVPEEKMDSQLPEKLKDEADGILMWAVKWYLKYQKNGLKFPEEVEIATKDYQTQEDSLGNFLDACILPSPEGQIVSSELYNYFKKWAEREGEYPLSQKMFSKRMEERGYKKKRKNTGYIWDGITVSPHSKKIFDMSPPYPSHHNY